MENDLRSIKEMCDKYLTEPKLVIVQNGTIKGQIQKTLLDKDIYTVNLYLKTAIELAQDIILQGHHNSNYVVVDKNGIEDILYDILTKLKQNEELEYFDEIEITSGLTAKMAETILEIKKAGYNSKKVTLDLVKNETKKRDLLRIISEYNKYLSDNGYWDMVDIIEGATKSVKKCSLIYSSMYVLETCDLCWVEQELLKEIGYSIKLVDDKKYLDYKEISKNIDNIDFKRVYGDNAEIKEVIRTIINNKIPFDKVLIVALNSEPYTQLLYQQLSKYIDNASDLPITFGNGISIAYSGPAKFALALIKWIANGYTIHDFVALIANNSMKLQDGKNEHSIKSNIINLLKSSDLTWQRDTYLSALSEYRERLSSHQQADKVQQLDIVINLLSDVIFPNVPVEDDEGLIYVNDFILGIKKIMKSCCNIFNVIDNEGYEAVLYTLDNIIKDRKMSINEIFKKISKNILEIRIHTSMPSSGKIHFTTFTGAEWAKREYTFLVGMDVVRFPSNINQNPILLDEEREDGLVKSTKIIENNIKNMSRFLESLSDKVYVSYSYFDTIQNRENFPSFIYKALVQNIAEKENISIDEFEKAYIKTINLAVNDDESVIDENDYILRKSNSGKHIVVNEEMKLDEEIEFYVDISGMNLEISPSSLMTYLGCGYKYYLKYILKLQGITDKELDKLGWLSHFEIGTLYHEIFELFEKKIIKNEISLESEDVVIQEIKRICADAIAKYEKALPTASEYHTEKEKEIILANCIRFAQEEVRRKEETEPLLTEYRFGSNKSCKLRINDENVYITGIIDRVDLIKSTNTIKIIDYKSGSTYGYDVLSNKNAPLINEKSVQPILYYLALKELSKSNPDGKVFNSISEAEYYFVTEKGEYEKIRIDFTRFSEEEIINELGKLVAEIKKGYFMKNEKSNCKYCEYADSCRYKGGEF